MTSTDIARYPAASPFSVDGDWRHFVAGINAREYPRAGLCGATRIQTKPARSLDGWVARMRKLEPATQGERRGL